MVCLPWFSLLWFCRWDFKERVRSLRVNKGLKGFRSSRCFQGYPQNMNCLERKYWPPIQFFEHDFIRWNTNRFQSWQATCRMSCEKVPRDERWRIPALLRISMMRVYFQVLILGWQDFFEVLEKVFATGGEHLQLTSPHISWSHCSHCEWVVGKDWWIGGHDFSFKIFWCLWT